MKIKLPQFIIIKGPSKESSALTHELMRRFDLACFRFSDPLVEAAIAVFFDGNSTFEGRDMNDYDMKLPYSSSSLTLGRWLEISRAWHRAELGQDILGRIFLDTYVKHNWEDVFPNVVIPDNDEPRDVHVLRSRYDDILIVDPKTKSIDDLVNDLTPQAA